MTKKLVSIDSKYVQCALKVRCFNRVGTAMSDCCRAHATSAVLYDDGMMLWRCPSHIGLRDIRTQEYGPVVTHIVQEAS